MHEYLTPTARQIHKKKGGVDTNAPPAVYMDETIKVIDAAVSNLKPNEKGILTWIATTEGVNMALVSKVNDHVDVTAWFGRTWGGPIEAGIAGRIHW